MLWRLLLRLPENAAELASVSLRGTHPAYRLMHREYPVGGDHRLFLRLQAVCSNLAHWTPLLAEVDYLPALVYPFVLVFGADEVSDPPLPPWTIPHIDPALICCHFTSPSLKVAATETVMTLLMWWGHSWMATHPHPPVHITDSLDALLRLHDPPLHAHLHSLKPEVSPGLLGWSLLSSLFTHVLARRAWLPFMDLLFSHIEDCALSLLAPVALLHGLREDILAASDERAVMACCHCHARVTGAGCPEAGDDTNDGGEEGDGSTRAGGQIDMAAVRTTLLTWLSHTSTPPEYLTAVGPLSEGSDEDEGSEEHKDKGPTTPTASAMRACVNRSCGRALLYLPPLGERYPAFEGLPKPTYDWQIAQVGEREKESCHVIYVFIYHILVVIPHHLTSGPTYLPPEGTCAGEGDRSDRGSDSNDEWYWRWCWCEATHDTTRVSVDGPRLTPERASPIYHSSQQPSAVNNNLKPCSRGGRRGGAAAAGAAAAGCKKVGGPGARADRCDRGRGAHVGGASEAGRGLTGAEKSGA